MVFKKIIAALLLINCLMICRGQDKCKQTNLEFKILNKEILISENYSHQISKPEFKSIRYSITNHSSKTYAIILDTVNTYIYSNYEYLKRWFKTNNDTSDRQLFKLGIKITNDGGFHNTGYNIVEPYFENLPFLKDVINKSLIIILKPKETIIRNLEFTYPIIEYRTKKGGLAQFFLLDDSEYFSLFLFQNEVCNEVFKCGKQRNF